jgi:hypothetical protein
VNVLLTRARKEVSLIVEDNGKGFDVSKVAPTNGTRKGMGLLSMQERATLIGADFELESHANAGTTVFLRLRCKTTRREFRQLIRQLHSQRYLACFRTPFSKRARTTAVNTTILSHVVLSRNQWPSILRTRFSNRGSSRSESKRGSTRKTIFIQPVSEKLFPDIRMPSPCCPKGRSTPQRQNTEETFLQLSFDPLVQHAAPTG